MTIFQRSPFRYPVFSIYGITNKKDGVVEYASLVVVYGNILMGMIVSLNTFISLSLTMFLYIIEHYGDF